MKNAKGAEDSVWWKKVLAEGQSTVVEVCRSCGRAITLWHCADDGCPWCASCGTKATAEARKNGKG